MSELMTTLGMYRQVFCVYIYIYVLYAHKFIYLSTYIICIYIYRHIHT